MTPLEQFITAVLDEAAKAARAAPPSTWRSHEQGMRDAVAAIRALSAADLARELAHLMPGEPVGWIWKTKGAGNWFYCRDLNWLDPKRSDEIDAQQIYTHPSDAESQRAEVESLRWQRDEWQNDFRALEKAIVGDTGLSAMTVAAQARLFRPRAEKAEADLAAMTTLKRSYAEMKDAAEAERDAALARVRELENDRDNWRNSPESDERWCAGNDYALTRLCAVLGVDPGKVDWDGSDGSLQEEADALIWRIIQAKYDATIAPPPDAELDALVAEIIAAWPPVLAIIRDYDEQFPYAELEGDDEKVSRLNRAIAALRARKGGAA